MIKKAESISNQATKEPYYRVSASLLNKWSDIFNCEDYVKESDDDTMSYEDKVLNKMKLMEHEFIDMLNKIPTPQNEYMLRGIEFENKVCNGLDKEFSPIVENGTFQLKKAKKVIIDGEPILLYGILDVLKGGRIYDIKRVSNYKYPKYKKSHQHSMYLELFPSAYDFTYIIRDDKGNSYYENYIRENIEDIYFVISQFITYLKSKNLFEIFKKNYVMYL